MMSIACRICACLLFAAEFSAATAQGFRVEGQVYRIDQSSTSGRAAEIRLASSVTLFHKGNVYDYEESADEVIIFEPTARRFTILNTARGLRTNADFDEIGHLMDSRRIESKRYLQELRQTAQRGADKVVRSLEFELAPSFRTEFDATGGVLKLNSDSWKYRVETHAWEDADQVREYLVYADWISQLNSVLHPDSRFPEPRILLNKKLRELNRVPTSVTRDLRPSQPLILRADHKFIADLSPDDRRLIRVWNALAKDSSLSQLSLRSYQEAVLVSQR